MYLIQVDHIVYERKGGTPFTLVEAMREVYGTGHAAVLRLDGSVAVRNAGSTSQFQHVPSGRMIGRH